MLRPPGTLVADYLERRRGQILHPPHFFISCAFVQIAIGVEIVNATWAVTQFSQLPRWRSALRVSFVLGVGYGLLTALVGLERAGALLIPQMPT